ncbi:Phosphopantetheine adenylyltransferase [Alicyclobacillus hesperidum]|uniref:Phosphopantetheine adenylyltransferase n=2 Tax=Alicyclobacillus hesperidum TaxID=89784 RepID=A0A1H2UV85_9BACL|nr:Phosphopantetheine adenylyltransferase [Alicyclobacillus hesperidum]
MTMRKAVYPGTFDPFTRGHLDVVVQAATLFDELVVSVLHNPNKRPWFDVATRMDLIRDAVSSIDNVRVDSFEGLLVDYYRRESFACVVRGVRNELDFQAELAMAHVNRSLAEDLRIVFIPTSSVYGFVSSSLVKDVALHGGDVSQFVTPRVAKALLEHVSL